MPPGHLGPPGHVGGGRGGGRPPYGATPLENDRWLRAAPLPPVPAQVKMPQLHKAANRFEASSNPQGFMLLNLFVFNKMQDRRPQHSACLCAAHMPGVEARTHSFLRLLDWSMLSCALSFHACCTETFPLGSAPSSYATKGRRLKVRSEFLWFCAARKADLRKPRGGEEAEEYQVAAQQDHS